MPENIHLFLEILPHRWHIDCHESVSIQFDAVAGNLCRIKGMPYLIRTKICLRAKESGLDQNTVIVNIMIDLIAEVFKLLLQGIVRKQRDKAVRRKVPDQFARELPRNHRCDSFQAPVARMHSMQPVILPETRDIEDHRAIPFSSSFCTFFLDKLLCLAIEIMHAREICISV